MVLFWTIFGCRGVNIKFSFKKRRLAEKQGGLYSILCTAEKNTPMSFIYKELANSYYRRDIVVLMYEV